jgi:VanZ family protein
MSSIPGHSLPGHGSLSIKIISNLAHVPAYALITILWLKAFERESFSMLSVGNKFLLLGLCLFAALDEVHQSFVPGRTASMTDVGLDLLGIFFGFWIFRYVKALRYSQVK